MIVYTYLNSDKLSEIKPMWFPQSQPVSEHAAAAAVPAPTNTSTNYMQVTSTVPAQPAGYTPQPAGYTPQHAPPAGFNPQQPPRSQANPGYHPSGISEFVLNDMTHQLSAVYQQLITIT